MENKSSLDAFPTDPLFDAFQGIDFRSAGLYESAEWYDLDYAAYVGEQSFYSWMTGRYVPEGAAYVELGAGTGRLSIPLAQEGFRVHGVEPAKNMRDTLWNRVLELPPSAATHTVEDAYAHDFWGPDDAPIGLVAFPFNGILHVRGRADLLAAFDHIRSRLLSDGVARSRFALDLTAPCWETMAMGHVPWGRVDERPHPADGRRVSTCDTATFDSAHRVLRTTFRYVIEGEPVGAEITLEQFMWTYAEILSAAKDTGFGVEHIFGDVDFAPFSDGMPRLLLCLRPVR